MSAVSQPSRRGRALPAWPAGRPLRQWQQVAAAAVFAHEGDSFLASATPAAGKTTFGLHVAHRMLAAGPRHPRGRRRADDRTSAASGRSTPRATGSTSSRTGRTPPARSRAIATAIAVTYATVAAGAGVHRRRAAEGPTLLIADEPHHMGDLAAWGAARQQAFERATFRLLLSGTPFRSDNTPIPWVAYDDDGVSRADYAYGYTDALLDGVCRPVTFHTYGGDMEWMSDGRRRRADFDVVLPAAEAGAPPAHGARPGRRLGHARAARRPRRAGARCAAARTPTPAGSWWRSTRSTPSGSPAGSRRSPASGPRS